MQRRASYPFAPLPLCIFALKLYRMNRDGPVLVKRKQYGCVLLTLFPYACEESEISV